MGLIFRKRLKVDDDTAVNLSTAGASVSRRVGKRLTLSTRGGSIRIFKGLSFRWLWRR